MSEQDSTVIVFKLRKANIWKYSKRWLLILAVGIFIIWYFRPDGRIWDLADVAIYLIGFALAFLSFGFINHYIHKYYKCPRCNKMPMTGTVLRGPEIFGYERMIALNVKKCPSCGVKLKDDA